MEREKQRKRERGEERRAHTTRNRHDGPEIAGHPLTNIRSAISGTIAWISIPSASRSVTISLSNRSSSSPAACTSVCESAAFKPDATSSEERSSAGRESSRRPRASASSSRFSVGRGWQSCQTGQLCQRVKDLGEERPSECDAGINRARVSINRREQGAAPRERSWGAPTLLSRSGGERGGRGSEHPISVLECILGC